MQRRAGRLGISAALAAALVGSLVAVAAAYGRADAGAPSVAAAPQSAAVACSSARIGVMGPFTGGAASIGQEQLKWARFGLDRFNRQNRTRYGFVESDTQLVASIASTRAVQLASNRNVLITIGPAGSQEVQAVARTFRGMAYISASATNTSLTIGARRIPSFWRVVGNDASQSVSDARFIKDDLGARRVWIIDDQTTYSVPLANGVQRNLRAGGVTVTRESVNRATTDFSSLVTRIPSNTQVVFLPWQIAANAATFYQQLREQGKRATIVGSDGLDSGDFLTANGSYFSAFAPDIHRSRNAAVRAIVNAYIRRFGANAFRSNFGPPMYVAMQVAYIALKAACADGQATRAEVRSKLRSTNIPNTLLGFPMRFNRNHDPVTARFFIFRVVNGKTQFIR